MEIANATNRVVDAKVAPRRRRLRRPQELGLVFVVLLLGMLLALLADPVRGENGFLRPSNLIPSVFTTMSWIAVMAVGMTVVVISGGIDLSVGSIMGLSALACAATLQGLPETTSAWVAIPLGVGIPLAVGLLCGAINGAAIIGLRMHPFIVTLGTLSIFRGIALISVKEGSLPYGDHILPPAFTDRFVAWTLEYERVRGAARVVESFQPVPMLLMLLVLALGWIYLRKMVWGRETYAIGGNEEAARFAGLSIGWVKMRVYLISGLCAGMAGMISCAFYKSAATNTGSGYELMVVASAVVGGASLSGGKGTALGAVLGALIIQIIDNGISILSTIQIAGLVLHVSKEYTQIIIGVAIIIAVAVDRLSDTIQQRRLARMGRSH
jgi:ribose/xylose/arabinose/galactoside ABC-type transport system permease subunit